MSSASFKPPSVPWNPWWALLIVGLLLYVVPRIIGTLVSFYPLLQGWTEGQAIDWLRHSVFAQFVYFLLTAAFTVGAIHLFLKYYKCSLRDIGLLRPRWRDLGYGLLAAPIYYLFYIVSLSLAIALFPALDINQKQEIGFEDVQGILSLLLVFLSLVVITPIMEEILMRGFLYSSLKKILPLITAAFMTSLVFAIAHLPAGGAAGPLYVAAVDTFVLSLVLIYLREKTGSLWAPITLHAAKNSVAFASLFILHLR